ncbi:uncharacterized protein L199_003510 [Kwoniella botswanensis]|uniref:uncharacterized protein n=1 Tax=Kwoniella botswanensis TaxID=1268659 RepID=UPI00315D3C6A
MPRTEETRKADEQDRLWAAKFPNGQARQAERERLKDEAGCNHIRFTNTVSSEDNIPVTFYQMSTNGDQTKVGTGIAKFVSEYSVDIQIPELIEADVTTPHIPPLGYTREDGSYCRVFKDVKEVKHYISKIKDVRDLHGSYGVPGYQTEKWLELTSITIPKDDINPDTSTIISVEVENTPQEEFWLTFSRRWPKRDRCMSVPGTTHSQRTIEYSDLKWDINFDPEKI